MVFGSPGLSEVSLGRSWGALGCSWRLWARNPGFYNGLGDWKLGNHRFYNGFRAWELRNHWFYIGLETVL